MAKLNIKQEAFCREYIVDLNATQAAIRAGYSEKTANRISFTLLTKVDIQNRIAELLEERNARTQVNADYVLNRLIEIDQMDLLDIMHDDWSFKQLGEWPKVWRQFISGVDVSELKEISEGNDKVIGSVLKKIKWPDKVKNLELLGKHTGVQAFKEKIELSGSMAHTVTKSLFELFDD